MNWITTFDEALFGLINYPAGRIAALDRLVFDIADSNLLQGGLFLAVYWSFWFTKDDATRDVARRTVVSAMLSGVVVAVIARLLQLGLPFHQRPLHTPSLAFRLPIGLDANTLNAWNSFPSDHAVFFFALCVPIWARSRRLGALALLWTLLVVCLPRIYLGYHYPSDVLAGAVVGVIAMLATQQVVARTGLRERIVRWEELHSARFYAVAFVLSFELALLFSDLRHFGVDAVHTARAVFGDALPSEAATRTVPMLRRSD
jgi:undecaprenyl-diphosphatase